MKSFTGRKATHGYSLIEFGLIIGAIAFAAVLIWQNWGTISSLWKSGTEAQNMVWISNTVSGTSVNGNFGTGSLNGVLEGEGQGGLSISGTGSATAIKNAFGGTVTIDGTGNTAKFVTTTEPTSACKSIVTSLSSALKNRVTITTDSQTFAMGEDVVPTALSDACAGGQDNTVTWTILAN